MCGWDLVPTDKLDPRSSLGTTVKTSYPCRLRSWNCYHKCILMTTVATSRDAIELANVS